MLPFLPFARTHIEIYVLIFCFAVFFVVFFRFLLRYTYISIEASINKCLQQNVVLESMVEKTRGLYVN